MSHLHRFYAGHAASVWELEARWMREAGTFRPPAAVQWIATRACDLTCSHCYSDAGPRHSGELDTREALALVDTIADMGCDQLVLAGGEPLLRKDLHVIVAHALERGLRWAMHTHGGLVMQRADLFRDTPPAMVAVSLDGPQGIHDRIRGRQGSYRDALGALRFLADETPCEVVVAGTVVNRLNADHLADMEADVRASGATSWGLHLFAPEGRGAANRALFPTPGQLQRAAAFARRKRAGMHVELDNEWGSAGPVDPFYRDHTFLCGAGRFTCVVGAEGSIFPCTTTDPAEAEGNVRTDDLREVWRAGFGRFRGDGTDAACADGADCWLQTRHGNSARADAFGVAAPKRAVASELPTPRRPSRPSGALRWAAVAALSATMGVDAQAADAEECTALDGFPAAFEVELWARQVTPQRGRAGTDSWVGVKRLLLEGGVVPDDGPLSGLARVLASTEHRSAAQLLSLLDEAEALGVWDGWLVAQLWQHASLDVSEAETRVLLARLERHARVVNTLVLARAQTGPVRYQPWMSKAARPSDHGEWVIPEALRPTAADLFISTDAGTWRSEVTLDVRIEGGSAQLCRAGKTTRVDSGSSLRIGRLDAVKLEPGARAVHGDLGELQRDGWLGASRLGRHSRVAEWVKTALSSGDAKAMDRVASILLVAAPEVRRAVANEPLAAGAPALRQLLVLYDE